MGAKKRNIVHGLPPGVVERRTSITVDGVVIDHKDTCRIDGDQEGRYTFHCVDVYENGNEAATLWGGPPGRSMFRTVGADCVVPAGRRQKPVSSGSTGAGSNQPTGDIRARREALRWSRGDLAERSTVGVPAIATLERGGTTRQADAAQLVEAALQDGEGGTERPSILTDDEDEDEEDE